MSQALYYPHYTPSISHLRTLLLFYDNVKSIVPAVDSPNVLKRGHVSELNEYFGKSTFQTLDTPWKTHYWAESDTAALDDFKPLLQKHKKTKRLAPADVKNLEATDYFSEQRKKTIKRYENRGWRLIASQKIPMQLLDELEQSGLAQSLGAAIVDESGAVIEENPILMKGQLANFFLSRLAREIAGQTGLPSITFNQLSYSSHALKDGATRATVAGEVALNVALPIVVPPGLDGLNVGYYSEIRDEFKETRKRLNTVTDALSVRMGLNTAPNEQVFLQRIKDAHSDFKKEMKRAESRLRNDAYGRMYNGAFTVGASIAGAALGIAFTDDVVGSLVGAGSGAFFSLFGPKNSTIVLDEYSALAQQAVIAKARVSKSLSKQNVVLQDHLNI